MDTVIDAICERCRARTLPIGISLSDETAAPRWRRQGVRLFVIDNDQMVLMKGTRSRLEQFRQTLTNA